MILRRQRRTSRLENVPVPDPKQGELLIRIDACSVCRTDLHVVDAELPDPNCRDHRTSDAGVVEPRGRRFRSRQSRRRAVLGWTDGGLSLLHNGTREPPAIARGSPATRSTAATQSIGVAVCALLLWHCRSGYTSEEAARFSAEG